MCSEPFWALLKKIEYLAFSVRIFTRITLVFLQKKCARTPPVFLQICASIRNCLPLTMCFNFQVQNFLQQQEEEALHGDNYHQHHIK